MTSTTSPRSSSPLPALPSARTRRVPRRVRAGVLTGALLSTGMALLASPATASDATASITGTVTETGHRITTGVDVWLYTYADDTFLAETVTDGHGQYTFPNLAPGQYKIRFENQNENVEEWWENTATIDAALPLPVGKGESVVANAYLTKVSENLVRPTLSGTAVVGSTLTGAIGQWWPAPNQGFGSVWLRNGTPIPGATAASYTLTNADAGATITYRAVARHFGETEAADSLASAAVTGGTAITPVANLTPPTVVGTPGIGSTLHASAGTWSPAAVGLTHQWLRDGQPISGATASSLTLTAADAGRSIQVRVQATHTLHQPTAVTSAGVRVEQALTAISKPVVRGTARVGATLSLTAGQWSIPARVSHQWLRNGSPVPGATGTSWRLGAADAGARISVVSTAVAQGRTLTSTSTATAVVARATTTLAQKTSVGAAKKRTVKGKKVTTRAVVVRLTSTTLGQSAARATVKLTQGKRTVVRTVSLRNGTGTVTVPGWSKGKVTVRSTVAATGSSAAATRSGTVRVR